MTGSTDAPPKAAFANAIDYFNAQLDRRIVDHTDDGTHPDRPTTARDYFNQRGWDDATLTANRLGYAPRGAGLRDHLQAQGYDRETMIATGLFTDDLDPLWQGRYVLPYLDTDGRPVYAIARCTGSDGGGGAGYDGHPDDYLPGKYAKIRHTDPRVPFEEPIYGLDTVRDGEPVLITEGIADAITAHQAGYPCISPVTTQFKTAVREKLLAELDERGVDRAYLIQDAERPTSDVDDRDRLTLQQFGDGVKGAVKTAAYLSEHGVEARVADLPRPGLDKVDLDDYIQDWSDDLTPLLASARPVAQHPAYDPGTAKAVAVDAAAASAPTAGREMIDTDGDHSALFDLDIRDVTGLSWEYRGTNPLGHHGDSENYFLLLESHGVAYDHKYKVAYNALTYLLVDADERRPASPNGRLDDGEILAAWRHAKREGLIPDDDPIPHRALQAVAFDHDLADRDDLTDGWKLPAPAYNAALETVREEYGVDQGRDPVRGADADPVAPIALKKLDALTGAERARYARKCGLEIPSTDDARARLRDALFRELRAGNGNATVLDAPTALGKSHTVAATPWLNHLDVTGEAPVIHLHATRDARDEALQASREASTVDAAVLKGRKETCPLAGGDHDPVENPDAEDAPDTPVTIDGRPASEWFDTMCDDRGLPFSTAHALVADRNDQGLEDLPCQAADDAECPAIAQWNGIPRDDNGAPAKDVIHATHQFAHVPSLRAHTNVVIDEQPDYTADLGQERVRRMVTAYLREIGAPVTTWEAFVSLARYDYDGHRSDALNEADALEDRLGRDPPRGWYVDDPDAHALAPDLAKAVWRALKNGDADANGRQSAKVLHEPPRLDAGDEGAYAGAWLSVVVDDENTVRTIRVTPDFTQARAVVGLDAHPCMPLWGLNGAPDMTRDAILDTTERRLWRRYERGLTVVQVGDATRPRSGKKAREWMNDERVRTLLTALRDHYGDAFATAIAPVQVEAAVRHILEDVADAEHDPGRTMHYGAEKSRNDFDDEAVGYLYGCMDPGDGMILDALAELGQDATVPYIDCDHCDATGDCDGHCARDRCTDSDERCGVCGGTGEHREKGRTFDGDDADTAAALLASVRENHVAQGAGRYARTPDDPENRAVVYVHTDAVPAGFADLQVPGVEWLASDTQRAIIDELVARPEATTRELADAVDCTKEHVRQTLQRLAEKGLVDRRHGAGDHGADVYQDAGAEGGFVDLGETANGPLKDPSRWSLVVSSPASADGTDAPASGAFATDGGRPIGGGPPPGPPE